MRVSRGLFAVANPEIGLLALARSLAPQADPQQGTWPFTK